jgi:hypothetical protein
MISNRGAALVGAGVVLLLAGVFVVATGLSMATSGMDALRGRDALERGRAALAAGDLTVARVEVARGRDDLCTAHRRLQAPGAGLTERWPWGGPNVAVTRALVAGGCEAAIVGADALDALVAVPGGIAGLAPRQGALPIDRIAALAPVLADGAAGAQRAVAAVAASPTVGLLPPVADARQSFLDQLGGVAAAGPALRASTDLLPHLFGADAPRRYLVFAQNPAELRGTGGFLGAFSVATAEDGALSFDDFRSVYDLRDAMDIAPPSRDFALRYNEIGGAGYWLNLNFSPDVPTVAAAMLRLWEETEGQALDGVLLVDPVAVEHLMRVTGPVDVPAMGTVDPAEVVELMANEAYGTFDDERARKAALGSIAVTVLEAALRGEDVDPVELGVAVHSAVRGRHLQIHLADPTAQELVVAAGAAGELLQGDGESVAVVVNSRGVNKADYYTDRHLQLDVYLESDGSARHELVVTFVNETPREGMPRHVMGPGLPELEAGDNRSRIDVFAPAGAQLTAFGAGTGAGLREGTELGRPVFTTIVDIGSGKQESAAFTWETPAAWDPATGRYELLVQSQPTIRPTTATVRLHAPAGATFAEAGVHLSPAEDGADLTWEGTVDPHVRMPLRVG